MVLVANKGSPEVSQLAAGWSGILCVIAVAIALFFPGLPLPSATDSGASIGAFLDAHRAAWMIGAWLTFPELVFFLWFIVGLRTYLLDASGRREGLMLYMIAGAVCTIAAGLIATTLQIVLGVIPVGELGSAAVRTLYVAWLASGVPVLFMPLAATLFAAAEGLRNHPTAPPWLSGLAYAATLLCVLGTVTAFFASGPLGLNGPVGYAAFFAFAVWTLLTSVHLIRSNER